MRDWYQHTCSIWTLKLVAEVFTNKQCFVLYTCLVWFTLPYTHTHAHAHTHTYNTHVCTQVYTQAHTNTHVCIHTYAHIHTHAYIRKHAYLHTPTHTQRALYSITDYQKVYQVPTSVPSVSR